MPAQVGAQASGFLIPHDHLDITRGGILTEYSRWGAYRAANSAGSTITLANDTERILTAPTMGAERIKKTIFSAITPAGFQTGSFTIRYDYHNTLGAGFPIDMWVMKNGVTSLDYYANDNSGYLTRSFTYTGTFTQGDYISVEMSAMDSGNDAYCRNFRVVFGWQIPYFGDGSSRILSTPLALTDTDNPFTITPDDP